MRRSLRHPYSVVSHPSCRLRLRSGAHGRSRRLPTRSGRPLGLLAAYLDLARSFRRRARLRRPSDVSWRILRCRQPSEASDRDDWSNSPIWPPGQVSRHNAFASSTRSSSSVLVHTRSCSAPLPTFRRPKSTSVPLDGSCSPLRPSGALSRHGAFVSSTRSFLTLLARSWMLWVPPGTTASPPGSSGSSPGLPGEFSRFLRFECPLTRSDGLRGFFGFFPTSLMVHDAIDASALAPGSSSSTWVLLGESSRLLCSGHRLTSFDAFRSFFGRPTASSSRPDAPISTLVAPTSPLGYNILSPSSSTLRGSSGGLVVLPGLVDDG